MKLKNLFSRLAKTIESTYLCLRFPFLYPRNRFSGKHWTSWEIERILSNLHTAMTDTFWVKVVDTKPAGGHLCTTVHNNRYYINKNLDIWYVKLDKGKVVYQFDDSMLDDGTIQSIVFVEGNIHIVTNPGARYVGEHFITTHTDPFFKFVSKLVNAYYNFISIFHCIPTYTELDAMPSGWRKAFGIKMCKEIKTQLKEKGLLKAYRIDQIKEKFGTLRWYDHNTCKEVLDIINKYEDISYHTCINCGKPATWLSRGWISPYCDDCAGDTSRCTPIKQEDEAYEELQP